MQISRLQQLCAASFCVLHREDLRIWWFSLILWGFGLETAKPLCELVLVKDAQHNKKAGAQKADMHSTVSQAFQEV